MAKNYSFTLNILLLLILIVCTVYAQGTGYIEAEISEEDQAAPIPCRVWVDINNARYYKPVSADCTPYDRDMSFTCNGRFVIEVPAGNAMVHIERGKEYLPVNREVSVLSGQTTVVKIHLKRWINMAEMGWYSMDMHCHFGADSEAILIQQALADDINYQPVLTVWNHQEYKMRQYWQSHQKEPALFADSLHLITMNNQEIERIGGGAFESVGALHLIGLDNPLKNPETRTWPADVSLCEMAKRNAPDCIIDCDKPVWGENVVTAAFGFFDSAQLCHNHYHRFSDLDMCCGMAALKLTEPDAHKWAGLFWQTNRAYYSFLNCGLKLAATGGSAMGVMRVPLGYNRTYVKIEGRLTHKSILQSIRDGRTFATSGPMIFFTINDYGCGKTIKIDSKNTAVLNIKAQLKSIEPVESLEIIADGDIVKQIPLNGKIPDPVLDITLDLEISPEKSGWFAARAIYFNQNRFIRQVHSSPVYVLVEDTPIAVRKDAERLIEWVDRLIEINGQEERYRDENERKYVLEKYLKARRFYENVYQASDKAAYSPGGAESR